MDIIWVKKRLENGDIKLNSIEDRYVEIEVVFNVDDEL